MHKVYYFCHNIHKKRLSKVPEIQAAMIGAAASAFLMVLSNMSNRRERDIREIFNRLNQMEKAVARLEGNSRIN